MQQSGFIGTATCFGFAIVFIGALRVVLASENARRDQFQKRDGGGFVGEAPSLDLTDRTDKENLDFRYVL